MHRHATDLLSNTSISSPTKKSLPDSQRSAREQDMRTSDRHNVECGRPPAHHRCLHRHGLDAAWWFLRTQSGVVKPRLHAVVSVTFGLLWPVSFPWRVCVHTTARVIANYRLR